MRNFYWREKKERNNNPNKTKQKQIFFAYDKRVNRETMCLTSKDYNCIVKSVFYSEVKLNSTGMWYGEAGILSV